MLEVKTCSKCKVEKSVSEFHKSKSFSDGLKTECKPCRSKAHKQRMLNPKNKAKQESSARAWRSRNTDKVRENSKKWKSRNPEARAKNNLANKAHRAVSSREEVLVSRHKRAAQQYGGGAFTIDEWYQLLKDCGNVCLRCKKHPEQIKVDSIRFMKLVPDHILPLKKGGSSNVFNLQVLCQPCNNIKHANYIDYRPRMVREKYDAMEQAYKSPYEYNLMYVNEYSI